MKRLLSLLLAPLLAACTVVGIRSGTEEPPFEVVDRQGEAEIRRYPARLLAEIEVQAADARAARNAGFPPLAAYIFGSNSPGERIGMTAPVAQQGEGQQWRIGFFMPQRYDRASLPAPRDPRITLRELPATTVAVLRFNGSTSPASVEAQRARLSTQLAAGPWAASGEGGAWFYDPPWTLPPARRNEVWLPVARR
ncbi:MAG TPA: heme-binding protein [Roseococcus sp.]|nr:heme-binding protein [Roseococcus sp.]